jgi:hypothetical protein
MSVHAPWIEGSKPKDIAPSIFAISKKKKFSVHEALDNEFWIGNLNLEGDISGNQINEFYTLWSKVQETHLRQILG